MFYRGADKSLARPGRNEANVSGRMAWIFFGALPCRKQKTWWQLASWYCWNRARSWHASELVSFLVGLRTYQHTGTYRCKWISTPTSRSFWPISVHLGTKYFNLISEQCEIREDVYSRSMAYLKALNEILNPFSTFFFSNLDTVRCRRY